MERDLDIRRRCHVNTNEDGDRFVGVKADSDDAIVYFPLGYQLPETDAEIRTDIKHLFQVLSEFTEKKDRVLAMNKFEAPQTVDFPIHAYLEVINYYLGKGGQYYVETDPTYVTSARGSAHWPKTFRNQTPLVQQKDGVNSLIYTQFTVRSVTPNETKLITQINRYCVYESFEKLGWLYVPYMPPPPGPHPDIKTSIIIINDKLMHTFNDKDKRLFKAMKDMLEYLDEKTSEKQFYFGTDNFEGVWERLIDRVFGEKDKDKYFPRTRWLLDYGKYKEKRPLLPDSIMIYNGKYYVLDAKYYKYGRTGNPDDLPNASSINKQITYGEYLHQTRKIANDSLFNAFIMPYNMADNYFNLEEPIGTIGEAVGDWKSNKFNYERIQGIVVDTRYLMYVYTGNPIKFKVQLADCIEAVLSKGEVPPPRSQENN